MMESFVAATLHSDNLHIFAPLPLPKNSLPRIATDNSLAVHFSELKTTMEYLAIEPLEYCTGVMHQPVLEFSLIHAIISHQPPTYFQALPEFSFKLAFEALHEHFAVSFEEPFRKVSFIDFTISPGELTLSMFLTIFEVPFILATIRVSFKSLSIRLIFSPVSRITSVVGSKGKLPWSVESVVSKTALVIRPVWVDEDSFIEASHALFECSLVINSVDPVDFPCPVRTPLLPFSIIVAPRNSSEFVGREFFSSNKGDPQVGSNGTDIKFFDLFQGDLDLWEHLRSAFCQIGIALKGFMLTFLFQIEGTSALIRSCSVRLVGSQTTSPPSGYYW